jgi:hypothetical protein
MFLHLRRKTLAWFTKNILSLFNPHYIVRNNLIYDSNLKQAFNAFDKKDYSSAFDMFLKEAENGNPAAQYNTGLCYESNSGVFPNDQAAEEWYRKASEQGLGKAQYSLCSILAAGIMVDQDNRSKENQNIRMIEAFMWLTICDEQGCSESPEAISRLKAHMTPEQIAEAQKLAREWVPRN